MSDLQRAWAKSKLGLSSEPLQEFEEELDGDTVGELPEHGDDDSSSASSVSSTGTVIPSANQKLFARPHGAPKGRSYEPIPWTAYFERELFLPAEDGSGVLYHAYMTSPADKGPLFVMHHGGGSSGLSFAALTCELRKRTPSAGILAVDCRGHGATTAPEGTPLDLKLETLSADLLAMVRLTQRQMRWLTLPTVVLVGHSLGGAVVTELAKSGTLGNDLLGYAVLDVVEGSAMDALQNMQTYIATRPEGFASLESGIEWHLRTRTIRDQLSARASVPGLLVEEEEEEEEEDKGKSQEEGDAKNEDAREKGKAWRWRTDLGATQPFWESWFVGLSKKFLEARGAKLLMLAGTDRLDTELMIGQMQGKYAMQVFPEAGHFIHEDIPDKVAMTLADFFKRNDRSALVLPRKVSERLAAGEKV